MVSTEQLINAIFLLLVVATIATHHPYWVVFWVAAAFVFDLQWILRRVWNDRDKD